MEQISFLGQITFLKQSYTLLTKRALEHLVILQYLSEAEIKKFVLRLKFEKRLKYGWIYLKLYSMFQDISRRQAGAPFKLFFFAD